VRLLDAEEDPPQGKYRAQWNDDYHHAWHVLLTGEAHGYYGDYKHSPLKDIVRALGSGFVYQGEASEHRDGRSRGEPSGTLAPSSFVNFLQNHDQIGNRALGDRLEGNADPRAIEAALAITLLAPMVPMLFMGEEWGAKSPFPFFCDFEGDLAEAVRQGRRREFAGAYEKYGDEIPDPLEASTLQSAALDWSEADAGPGRKRLKLVQELLGIRHREIVPRLAGARFGTADANELGLVIAHWPMGEGKTLSLTANLSDREASRPTGEIKGTLIWGTEPDRTIPPWSVFWRIG
jgi:malto-oligosyltrehalose trehalohydrolase